MSYRNPQFIQQADPLAFSKGFEQGFSEQQAKFQADLEERQRLAKEADEALAKAYSIADMAPINGVDMKFNNALQDALNSVVEKGDFANASASDRAKMIQQLGLTKSAFARIGEIVAVDQDDWDLRNDKTLTKFRTALIGGEDISIDADGLNFKIKGSFGEITLDDISNKRIFNKSIYEESVDGIVSKMSDDYARTVSSAYKNGKSQQDIQNIENFFKSKLTEKIQKSDPDLLEYFKFNTENGTSTDGIVNTLFDKIKSNVMPPEYQFNQPQVKKEKPLFNFENLAMDIQSTISNVDSSILAGTGVNGSYDPKSGSFTYTTQGEKGEEIKQTVNFLEEPVRAQQAFGSIFDEVYSKQYTSSERPAARRQFIQSSIDVLKKNALKLNQTSQQEQMGPKTEQQVEQEKSVKEQILGIDTFKPNQELTASEKRKMTSGTDKKILAELNKQKLPVTYANIDRVSKYLNLSEIPDFKNAFLGRTKSDEELSAIAPTI